MEGDAGAEMTLSSGAVRKTDPANSASMAPRPFLLFSSGRHLHCAVHLSSIILREN